MGFRVLYWFVTQFICGNSQVINWWHFVFILNFFPQIICSGVVQRSSMSFVNSNNNSLLSRRTQPCGVNTCASPPDSWYVILSAFAKQQNKKKKKIGILGMQRFSMIKLVSLFPHLSLGDSDLFLFKMSISKKWLVSNNWLGFLEVGLLEERM